jgi:hypothetical protein
MQPSNLILRCYGYCTNGKWTALCLDFNLAVEAETPEQLKSKMQDMIESYIETVLDTDDSGSIASLMMRKSPLKDWVFYYALCVFAGLRKLPGKIFFKQIIPFRLTGRC